MALSSRALGLGSALGIVATFVVFTLCFIGIALTQPLFIWTDLPTFLQHAAGTDRTLQHVAMVAMLVFGVLYVLLVNAVYEWAPSSRRLPARISLSFGIGFAALTGINYFVQLSAVRLAISHGATGGLEQLVQANPYSLVAASNVLGWTVFLGMSSLFLGLTFTQAERLVRWSFVLNGVFCLLGGLSYLLDLTVLVFLTLNVGLGGTVLAGAIGLCRVFGKEPSP